MCSWITRVRGVQVCGRKVFLTDAGLKVGYQGPLVPQEQFLADLAPELRSKLEAAIPLIQKYHADRLAGVSTEAQAKSLFGDESASSDCVWGAQAISSPPEDEDEDGDEDGI